MAIAQQLFDSYSIRKVPLSRSFVWLKDGWDTPPGGPTRNWWNSLTTGLADPATAPRWQAMSVHVLAAKIG
jgi:hypothetical protein